MKTSLAEQINFVHCLIQELETLNVSLPMGDYSLVYQYLEDVREHLENEQD